MANNKNVLAWITNNFWFKVLAFVLAFILWFIVCNIDNPNKNKAFNIKVSITNTAALSDLGKCYQILDGSDTTSFVVNAKRSTLEDLNESDFAAVADMENLEISEDGQEAFVPVSITVISHASDIKITRTAKPLHISLENVFTKKYEISVRSSGEVAEGHALAKVEVVNPTVITVQGPESVVDQIDMVVATLDVTDMESDFTDNVRPVFYNKDGQSVDISRLVSISSEKIMVSATIMQTKSVPLSFSTMGAPAPGYDKVDVKSDLTDVTIQGPAEILASISKIEVPSSAINIAGATGNLNLNIDLTEYLPEGVTFVKNMETTAVVTVVIESDVTKSFTIPSEQITIEGLDLNLYKASIVTENVAVRIKGKEDNIEKLSEKTMTGTIDLSDLQEGTHTVSVKFNLNADLYETSSVTVDVKIESAKAEEDNSDTNTNNQNANTGTGTGTGQENNSDKNER